MTIDPNLQRQRANASLERGVAYIHRKQWQQAASALQNALTESPQSIPVHYHLAFCFANTGNALRARRLLEDALALPHTDDAWRVRLLRLLARVSMQASDYALAAECLESAVAITGLGGAPILNQLAQVFCKSGDFERGFELFVKAMPR